MPPSISVNIMQDLRCAHCRRFVTCGPVYVTPDSSILCGRCVRFAKKIYRNVAFEALAGMYVYKCHYWPQHCNKKLSWNESLEHERNCLYKSSCNVFCSKPGTFFKSDRKLLTDKDISLQNVGDDVLEYLKCAVCESYLSNSPVYIVSDGKNVCHRCCHSNGIPQNTIRNLAYETIASNIMFPCIYRFRGCTMRLKFGRDMWAHEHDCSYGQIYNKAAKKPSTSRGGKQRGVIETHSGHIWGTITPNSALFAPPKSKNQESQGVNQQLHEALKRKNKEEVESRHLDSQSVDSIMSKSTFDSLADNISRTTGDNVSRSTVDNISRASSRPPTREEDRRYSNDTSLNEDYRSSVSGYSRASQYQDMSRLQKIRKSNDDLGLNFTPVRDEVAPLPTPTGFQRPPHNGYFQENLAKYTPEQYAHLYHYPPVFVQNPSQLQYSASFNYPPPHNGGAPVHRSESLRVGNADLINELKERQNKKNSVAQNSESNPYVQCNNLQDIVQKHNELI